MANDTFATFLQVSALGSTDYLVGYQNISETRISYPDLATSLIRFVSGDNSVIIANSANWNSTYSTVNANSASWNSTYSTVNSTSSLISLSSVQSENIFVLGNDVNVLSAVSISTVDYIHPVSAFVVQINGINFRILAYQ